MTAGDLPARRDGDPARVPVDEPFAIEHYESSYRAGPLPSPAELAAYDQISPDLVDRIVAASEQERAHRHRIDAENSRRASAGLAAGFAVAVLFLMAAAWLIYNDHDIAGVVLGSFDIVALTAVFVLGRRNDPL